MPSDGRYDGSHTMARPTAPDAMTWPSSDGYRNARVAHFSAAGRLLNEWGSPGAAPGQFAVPHGLAIDAAGRVYVADRENSRVQVFDPTGALVRVWPQRAETRACSRLVSADW